MCVHILQERGASRNNDALKHPLTVKLAWREVPSTALTATFVSLAATFPFHFTPSPNTFHWFSPLLFGLLSAFFLFSLPLPWYSTVLLPCTTPFFLDSNSSLALSSSVQSWFLTPHMNRARGAGTLRSSCFPRPSNLIADSFIRVCFLLQHSETRFCFFVTPSAYISEHFPHTLFNFLQISSRLNSYFS